MIEQFLKLVFCSILVNGPNTSVAIFSLVSPHPQLSALLLLLSSNKHPLKMKEVANSAQEKTRLNLPPFAAKKNKSTTNSSQFSDVE